MLSDDIYPTRGAQERLTERKDPVLYGWDHCRKRLSEPELLDYEKHGFVVIPDVFTAGEALGLRRCIPALKRELKKPARSRYPYDIPAGERNSLLAPEAASRDFRDLACDSRILDRVQQILGSQLYLHRSRIHLEGTASGSSYPWHSAFETWHAEDGVPRMRGVEVWIMLNDNDETNGCMRSLAKSHYIYAACTDAAMSTDLPGACAKPGVETLTRLLYFGERVDIHGKPGTMVICDSNLMYASTASRNRRSRATVMLSYNSVENLSVGHPFAGDRLRPPPVVSADRTALKPRECDFAANP